MSKRPRRKFETATYCSNQIWSNHSTQAARTHSLSPTGHLLLEKQFQTGELFEGPTRREKALIKDKKLNKLLTDFTLFIRQSIIFSLS